MDRVSEIIVEQLGVSAEEIKPEASFIDDLGADSLDIVELVMAMVAGRGTFEIKAFSLSPPEPGERASFTELAFDACLSWPVGWSQSKD